MIVCRCEEFKKKGFMMNNRTMKKTKNIAFVASDNKNSELIEWSYFNRDLLLKHEIIATGSAIKILEGTFNKPVHKLISGPLGGYRMLADIIAEGKIDILVFFTSDEFQHKDFEVLMESVKDNNVIIAFNKTTADFIFNSPLMSREYFVKKPASVSANQKKDSKELELKKDRSKVVKIKAA
jgi:methylglyoxal synthase